MSHEHETALTNTLIELHLRRGLNIILGEIGTGKTTLSRKLVQELGRREKFLFQIMLNPSFENEKQFMTAIMRNFNINTEGKESVCDLHDGFERFLLDKTLKDNRIVILIIDEAQKMSDESMESLRVLLNYETNEFKLLQIVLLGQMELMPKISRIENFYDRINFKFTLFPFNLGETKEMVNFRVRQAGYRNKSNVFLDDAIREIYDATGGYPRRITILCHKALKQMILKNRYVVDGQIIRGILQEEERLGWQKSKISQRNNSFFS
jgi:general secretion pathway protein A